MTASTQDFQATRLSAATSEGEVSSLEIEQQLAVIEHGARLVMDACEAGDAVRAGTAEALHWIARQMTEAHWALYAAYGELLAERRRRPRSSEQCDGLALQTGEAAIR